MSNTFQEMDEGLRNGLRRIRINNICRQIYRESPWACRSAVGARQPPGKFHPKGTQHPPDAWDQKWCHYRAVELWREGVT